MLGWLSNPTDQDVVSQPLYHEGDIQLQVDATFEELQRDLQQSAFKEKYCHYFIMTLNIGQRKKTGPGTADHRRLLLKIILKNCTADIIFRVEYETFCNFIIFLNFNITRVQI